MGGISITAEELEECLKLGRAGNHYKNYERGVFIKMELESFSYSVERQREFNRLVRWLLESFNATHRI